MLEYISAFWELEKVVELQATAVSRDMRGKVKTHIQSLRLEGESANQIPLNFLEVSLSFSISQNLSKSLKISQNLSEEF